MTQETKVSLKANIKNFWDYYKVWIIAVLIILPLLCFWLGSFPHNKNVGMRTVLLNTYVAGNDTQTQFWEEFASSVGMNTQQTPIVANTALYFNTNDQFDNSTYDTIQTLSVNIAAGEIDCLIADPEAFRYCAYWEYFVDLRTVLPADTISKLSNRLYYIDMQTIQALEDAQYESVSFPMIDPWDPAGMQVPIPVGIAIDPTSEFFSVYQMRDQKGVVGIPCTTTRQETALAFVQFLLDLSPGSP